MLGISIHALRKESDDAVDWLEQHCSISIHALRKESDGEHPPRLQPHLISIHALRKESDGGGEDVIHATIHFNPRSP